MEELSIDKNIIKNRIKNSLARQFLFLIFSLLIYNILPFVFAVIPNESVRKAGIYIIFSIGFFFIIFFWYIVFFKKFTDYLKKTTESIQIKDKHFELRTVEFKYLAKSISYSIPIEDITVSINEFDPTKETNYFRSRLQLNFKFKIGYHKKNLILPDSICVFNIIVERIKNIIEIEDNIIRK